MRAVRPAAALLLLLALARAALPIGWMPAAGGAEAGAYITICSGATGLERVPWDPHLPSRAHDDHRMSAPCIVGCLATAFTLALAILVLGLPSLVALAPRLIRARPQADDLFRFATGHARGPPLTA